MSLRKDKGPKKNSDTNSKPARKNPFNLNKKVKGDFSLFEKKPKKDKNEVMFDKFSKNFPNKLKQYEEEAAKPKDKVLKKSTNKVEKAPTKVETRNLEDNTKLNKFIAHAGVCSRRAAADLVKEGQITVNGKVEKNPAYVVLPNDVILFEGKTLQIEEKLVYYIMNKPKNTITSTNDEKGRRTVMDLVSDKVKERVFPVGRLDRNTTGLLLLTNDGALAERLSHPSHKMKKLYLAKLDKNMTTNDIDKVKAGLSLEDGITDVDDIQFNDGIKNEILITIHSGKNRIVRRIFEHLNYEVEKLDRLIYAGLTKKDLPRGYIRPLDKQEIIMLKHFTKGK